MKLSTVTGNNPNTRESNKSDLDEETEMSLEKVLTSFILIRGSYGPYTLNDLEFVDT